jgi:hypothetical protein
MASTSTTSAARGGDLPSLRAGGGVQAVQGLAHAAAAVLEPHEGGEDRPPALRTHLDGGGSFCQLL